MKFTLSTSFLVTGTDEQREGTDKEVKEAAKKAPYHHGDLRRALVQAGTELAREGGPAAIVLREAARRVGVSATAAYRYFSSLPDLVQAVADDALGALARSMQAELAKCEPSGDAGRDAVKRLDAVGRGYIHFALAEPGLFATAFSPRQPNEGDNGAEDPSAGPYQLLERALDDMVEAGVLDPADRVTAPITAWASVHGLSQLLLGPMAGEPGVTQDEFIDTFLDLVDRGLISRQSSR
jgi:AcrR family transcriptional regulator